VELEVSPRAKADPLRVSTPELSITVTGTQFSVRRDERAQRTWLAVVEGSVRAESKSTGVVRTLGAGETWIEPEEPAPLPEPAVAPPEQDIPREPPPPSPAEIRSQLQQGQIKKAKATLSTARSRARSNRERAELALVEAEILLAEKRPAPAIRAYLTVAKRYRGTGQADVALFAAAQLALEHPGAGASGPHLLRRYTTEYPQGRFREDAQRLLNALKP
jgi:ferric-dicitrate binding protein FerR (iron transport regulator)